MRIPDSNIEIINPNVRLGQIRFGVFDFDGTLSVIREGWPEVMIPMMVDVLMETPRHESREEIHAVVKEFVERLTGKQTIYQMLELVEEIKKRGGTPADPLVYKQRYLDLLWERICKRVYDLEEGGTDPDDRLIMGARRFLDGLTARGVKLFLASGTDDDAVQRESRALKVDKYFKGGIYGALPNWTDFSKKKLIAKIISDNKLSGPELFVVGDGFVEIEEGHNVGAVTIALPTNEVARCGEDAWKRNRLVRAGADLVAPDFTCADKLLGLLFGDIKPPKS
ncbi:MAG TPA: HAD hydrolase-like protein [Candidatus Brocadiia bacterium]|nr:HAD hydrolase-like protein [Candidatus Brocadiia bacterium]